jgi:hypothetical protein
LALQRKGCWQNRLMAWISVQVNQSLPKGVRSNRLQLAQDTIEEMITIVVFWQIVDF